MLKHSIALQSIGKGYPNFSVFQQKWNIPQTGWPPCNLTFAISPRFSTLHFHSLEMSLALTLSKSVMLSGSNVFQTKTNKTKGNRGNLERLSNYYKRKERATKDETTARTGKHWTTSDVPLAKTISHKKTKLWGDRRADFRNTEILSKITAVPRSKVTPSPGHLRSCCPGTTFPPGSTAPVQLSRSQHWTQATLQIYLIFQKRNQ